MYSKFSSHVFYSLQNGICIDTGYDLTVGGEHFPAFLDGLLNSLIIMQCSIIWMTLIYHFPHVEPMLFPYFPSGQYPYT